MTEQEFSKYLDNFTEELEENNVYYVEECISLNEAVKCYRKMLKERKKVSDKYFRIKEQEE